MPSPTDDLRSWARSLTDEIPPGRSQMVVDRAMRPVPSLPVARQAGSVGYVLRPGRLARRLSPVLVASMLFGILNLALAAAANPAAPGDALYGLDRGYERIASALTADQLLTAGLASERLDEAATLLERGEPNEALGLVREVLAGLVDQPDSSQARTLIRELAQRASVDNGQVAELVEIAEQIAVSD